MPRDETEDEALTYHASKVSWVTAEFVRRPPSWMPRAFVYGLTFTLVAAIAYAAVAEVAVYVRARGALVSRPALMPIVVPISLKVAQLHVSENQEVSQGELLLSTQDDLPGEDFERLREITTAIRRVLAEHRTGDCETCRERLHELSRAALQVRDVPELEATLAPAREALSNLLTAFSQYDQLQNLTASSRRLIDVNSSKIAQVRASHAESVLRREVEALTNEIVAAKNQITERTRAIEVGIETARDRLDVLLTTVVGVLEVYRSQRSIVAPLAGVVHDLRVSGPGQFVPGGSQILTIIPRGATFVAQLAVESRDISRVRPGLPVRLRLDAFPERQYGAVAGTVQVVPLAPTSREEGLPPAYAVVVQLERQYIEKDDERFPFRIGMQGEGRLVTRHESMLVNAARKLLSITDELGG